MKAVVAAFNQEKALVGAFSVIMNLRMEIFEALKCTHDGTDGGPLCPGQLQEDPVGGHAAAAGARGAARQGDRHQEDAQRRRGQKVGVRALADLHTLHLKLGYLSTKPSQMGKVNE